MEKPEEPEKRVIIEVKLPRELLEKMYLSIKKNRARQGKGMPWEQSDTK